MIGRRGQEQGEQGASFVLVRSLFLRAMALVYLAAFVSLWTQIHGLVGSEGILPVTEFLHAVHRYYGSSSVFRYPTLFWLSSSDAMLSAVCAAGTVASVVLLIGFIPIAASLACWVSYLSLFVAGQVFLGFQWDILLLEAGVLGILLSPPCLTPVGWRRYPPSRGALWLVRWLLFRLMFASGLVKLMSGDLAWRNLTALSYHYESQPLPPWTAWYMNQLPMWVQRISCALMFGVELIVPFFIFAGRRARLSAFWIFTGFQLIIAATGNYTFFNYLTIALGLSLLDDRFLRSWVSASRSKQAAGQAKELSDALQTPSVRGWGVRVRWLFVTAAVGSIALLSGVNFAARFYGYSALPAVARRALDRIEPFRLTGNYGLFAVMTKGRPEIVLEGSNDGKRWREYGFRYKIGDVTRRPGFVAPHQPRLDWQMWFAALSNFRRQRWFGRFVERVGEGSPPVLALLGRVPFPDAPPRYLRALLYDYRLTTAAHHPGGAWWTRSVRGLYYPVVRTGRR